MENRPLVSVVIPAYNCEKTIQYTICSVINQTFTDFELLIFDDGSTDDTTNIIESFSDIRIKLYKDGYNKGIACRLNQLINLASGHYLIRMDGDDLMFPDRLERQGKFLQEHPDVDVVGAPAIVIDENNNILGLRGRASRIWSFDDLFMSSRFIHPTVAGKTEWFRNWQYDESLSGCEDMDLWIRSFKNSVFADVLEPVLFYREPLIFRLKTYLKRQRLLLHYSWGKRCYIDNRGHFLQLICKILVSSIAAVFLHIIRCDDRMIRRRNEQLAKDSITSYNYILSKIVTTV